MAKMVKKTLEACGHTVLPDRSLLIGQKLVENAKIENSNATIWLISNTMTRVNNFEKV